MRYYRACCNDRIVSDCYTFCDNNTCAYPDFISYMNWCRIEKMPFVWINVVVQGSQHSVVSYKCSVSDEDAALVLELAACIDKNMVPDSDVFSKISVERCLYSDAFTDRLCSDPGNRGLSTFLLRSS